MRSLCSNRNDFVNKRLKTASATLGLRKGSGRLFRAVGLAVKKSSAAVSAESVPWYVK